MDRTIALMDLDAFFAAVEQAVNPALRGKAVLVGGKGTTRRSVVAAASYEAKRKGVDSGMSFGEALKLCPNAVIVPSDTAKYIHTSDRILEILLEFTPQVYPASIDEFYMDITHTASRFGGPVSLAQKIKSRICQSFHITTSFGIAPNKLLAKVICKKGKPDGLEELSVEEVAGFVRDLPVSDICGVGPSMRTHLISLGLLTCGDVQKVPIGRLAKIFGVWGYWLASSCRGKDDSPVPFYEGGESTLSVGHSQTLPRDCCDPTLLKGWLALLSERVSIRLRRRHIAGRTLTLTVRDKTFITRSHQRKYQIPTSDGAEILRRAWGLFTEAWRQRSVRLLGVSVGDLTPDVQQSLLEEERRRRDLLEAADRLREKFGEFCLLPASTLSTKRSGKRGG